MIRTALVTGGAGFIGSHLVRELLSQGVAVRVMDDLSGGHIENLAEIASDIEFRRDDIRDPDACRRCCAKVDIVFHLAALGSVPRSVKDPAATNDVNVVGTLNLLIAARDGGAGRFVYSSSSSVYGDTPILPKHEKMAPNPLSPYAVSKLAAEEYTRCFAGVYDMETVALRYFNVFGPRQDPESQYAAVIPRFISALLSGSRPTIYGDGRQTRDFTYVANVVRGNLLAATTPGICGSVYNIACGGQIGVIDILNRLADLLGVQPNPEFLPHRRGDIKHSCADISAARERLGYEPLVTFEDGLAQLVEHVNATRLELAGSEG